MSYELAKDYIKSKGYENNIIHFDISTATVDLASQALGVKAGQIAKTLSFKDKDENAFLIVMAGDVGVDNKKFKEFFNFKATMLSVEEVEEKVGHAVGGVCPFGIKENINVYMDKSLERFSDVYPACVDSNNVLHLSVTQLYELSNAKNWVDISKLRN